MGSLFGCFRGLGLRIFEFGVPGFSVGVIGIVAHIMVLDSVYDCGEGYLEYMSKCC